MRDILLSSIFIIRVALWIAVLNRIVRCIVSWKGDKRHHPKRYQASSKGLKIDVMPPSQHIMPVQDGERRTNSICSSGLYTPSLSAVTSNSAVAYPIEVKLRIQTRIRMVSAGIFDMVPTSRAWE